MQLEMYEFEIQVPLFKIKLEVTVGCHFFKPHQMRRFYTEGLCKHPARTVHSRGSLLEARERGSL